MIGIASQTWHFSIYENLPSVHNAYKNKENFKKVCSYILCILYCIVLYTLPEYMTYEPNIKALQTNTEWFDT